jgi:murein DD-endopeptidase MepM/ murein hydrolase activator NlpD
VTGKTKAGGFIRHALPMLMALLLVTLGVATVAAETYTVKPGDTLYDIGMKYGVEPEDIARVNALANPTALQVGQQLNIPTGSGSAASPAGTYTVANGDTLSGIADRFTVSQSALAAANGLSEPYRLQVGQQLHIPAGGGTAPAAAATNGSNYIVVAGDTLSGIADMFGVSGTAIASANGLNNPNSLRDGQSLVIPARLEPSGRGGRRLSFVWPAAGNITGYFHEVGNLWTKGYHEGLDIGASFGSVIRAAEDGVVVEADTGWNSGYGTYVKLDHGEGIVTLYGHMSQLAAKPGQEVRRGQLIGYVGSTGASTGPHLHFEVRVDGAKLDPLLYLP